MVELRGVVDPGRAAESAEAFQAGVDELGVER